MRYLKAKEIVFFNESIIKTKTPDEISGVREAGALDMLVQAPKEKIFGQELYPSILIINLATKHVFHNANKRTAFIATDVFMELNDYQSNFDFEEALDFILWIVKEHEVTQNFEEFKKEVALKLESKYMKK